MRKSFPRIWIYDFVPFNRVRPEELRVKYHFNYQQHRDQVTNNSIELLRFLMVCILYHLIQFGTPCDAWCVYEVLVSATSQTHRDIWRFSAVLCRRQQKISIFESQITKWFRHLIKIAVTNVTFQQFGRPRDAWLPNWIKWYSTLFNFKIFYIFIVVTFCLFCLFHYFSAFCLTSC